MVIFKLISLVLPLFIIWSTSLPPTRSASPSPASLTPGHSFCAHFCALQIWATSPCSGPNFSSFSYLFTPFFQSQSILSLCQTVSFTWPQKESAFVVAEQVPILVSLLLAVGFWRVGLWSPWAVFLHLFKTCDDDTNFLELSGEEPD